MGSRSFQLKLRSHTATSGIKVNAPEKGWKICGCVERWRVLRRSAAAILLFAASVHAVEIRVASFNIGAHWNEEFFDYSLGNPGTPDHDTVRDILRRIDADVVALQEIHSVDLQGNPNDLQALATSLGYPHLHEPPFSGVFDTSLKVVFLSRHPFISTANIGSAPGANEITRYHPVVKVDVPGTANDPVIISAHLKAGTTTEDRFRRAIEMKRLTGYLTTASPGADDNFIILGDFNPSSSNTTVSLETYNGFFTKVNRVIPLSYSVGGDVLFPVTYSTNMLSYFTTPSAVKLDPRQLNGSASTYNTSSPGGPVLDLIMVSPAIAGRPLAAEIYNSALDVSNSDGLPKAGTPLDAGTSATASDHYAVFADLELDADFPNLQLSLTNSSVVENSPVGTVAAQVTLPAVRTVPVTVALASDDAAAAMAAASTVVIPAGTLTAQVALVISPRNFIAEGQRSVSLMASGAGYDPSSAVLQVEDADLPYGFQNPGETVVENFAGFTGLHDPAPWLTTGGQPWLGSDDGSSALSGWRVYGSGPGFLTDGGLASISTVIENRSPTPLTALDVALDASQWRAVMNGAADRMHVDVVTDAGTIPLPGLTFTASQALPSGPVPGGAAIRLSAMATGLWIPPGGSFGLRVSFVPGDGTGPPPSDVFINEFHYDNTGADTGEFVEIVVDPGFGGMLSDIDILLYNGSTSSSATVYRTLNLAQDFTPGATSSGYRFFSVMLPPDSIQNGGNDGFAVVNKVTSQVLHLISYEGVFTAAGGPAAGMTSTSIGVSQNGTEAPGEAALGLTASGAAAGDFTWTKLSGIAHSPGQPNSGQIFVTPTLPRQGLGFDNLAVTFLTDNDLDGLPDIADPDDDNDGQSDDDEIAFGSGPLNPASRFAPVIARTASGLELSFPGAPGIAYTIEFSETLGDWHDLTTVTGEGGPIVVPLPMAEPAMFFRVRAAVPGS
jgi:endonuclease/exonuclease/phosphatase family metal-dependent hydrolase